MKSMMSRILGGAAPVAMILASSAAPLSAVAAGRPHQVDGPRILLSEVLPRLARRLDVSPVDLGPAPAPGKLRSLSRRQLSARLRAVGVAIARLSLPRRISVQRRSQLLQQARLVELVRAAIQPHLPKGALLTSLQHRGDLTVAVGVVRVAFDKLPRWRQGQQTLVLRLFVDEQPQRQILVRATVQLLRGPDTGQVLVKRGSRVTIVARAQGVVVRSQGVAQSTGAAGQHIPVLPLHSRRVVHARIVDAGLVEVEL